MTTQPVTVRLQGSDFSLPSRERMIQLCNGSPDQHNLWLLTADLQSITCHQTSTFKRSQMWSRSNSSSDSSCSSESSEEPTYLNLNVLPKPNRNNSKCCLDRCINGHCLVLIPVTCERDSACGSCYAKIRIKPVHVLCYHCTECDLDSCSDCITTDMKEILMYERSIATPSVQYTDTHGPGLYQGQLSPIKKREGHGRMDWTSENSPLKGSFYEGNWKNDKREGHGKFVYPDGGIYEGLWENDVKCGYGRRSFSNGFKYHGAFKNGMKHGKGIFKGVTGRWCFAVWENDQMVGPGRFPPKTKASVGMYDDDDD